MPDEQRIPSENGVLEGVSAQNSQQQRAKYHVSMRLMHWTMAVLILGLIAVGWYMTELPKEDAMRGTFYGLHKSFGVLVLGLVAVRLVLRLMIPVPPLPETIPVIVRQLSRGAHNLLYFFMVATPLSGYMMSNAFGHPVQFFGLTLPKFFPDSKELGGVAHNLHEILPYVMLALVLLHVLGALKHRFLESKENDVLRRML